jgi:hypothetical protein
MLTIQILIAIFKYYPCPAWAEAKHENPPLPPFGKGGIVWLPPFGKGGILRAPPFEKGAS